MESDHGKQSASESDQLSTDRSNSAVRRILRGQHTPRWLSAVILLIGLGLVLGLSAISSPPGPDEHVTVTQFTPQGPTDRSTNITIVFSNSLCSPDSLNVPVLQPPVTFDPPIDGIARWVASDKLRFYPDDILAPATKYTARFRSRDRMHNGNKLDESREFTFFTAMLRAGMSRGSTISIPDSADYRRVTSVLNFTYPVSIKDLREHLSLRGIDDAELGRPEFTLTSDLSAEINDPPDTTGFHASWRFITEAIPVSDRRQTYRLTIRKGLSCEHCGEKLDEDQEVELYVDPEALLHLSRVQAEYEGSRYRIYVTFNRHVAPGQIRDHLTISPDVEYTLSSRWSSIVLDGDFKPGDVFTINVTGGFMSQDQAKFKNDFSGNVEIPDYPASVTFVSQGAYLPSRGAGNLEIETRNIDSLTVEVDRVYENNLIYYLTGASLSTVGRDMKRVGHDWFYRDFDIDHRRNELQSNTLDMSGIIGDSTRGIYVVSVRDKSHRSEYDSRQVMLTDLGISARMADDYLMVWVHSLATVDPIGKATVRLYSQNNQVLLEGRTDSRGIVVFDDVLDELKDFEPEIITASKGDDLSYLEFADCLQRISDFDVSGRPMFTRGYEAFVYTDRGVYRPGDTCHLVSIVRGANASIPEDFPYIIDINDPRGRSFRTQRMTASENMSGMHIDIPPYAPTGSYGVTVRIGDDYVIGRASFLVEEFMPDRIAVTVTTDRDSYRLGDTISGVISGKFLFGPPTSGNVMSRKVEVSAKTFRSDRFDAYTFSSSRRKFQDERLDWLNTTLDDSGYHSFEYVLPAVLSPPSMLRGTVSATVSEQGGRSVGSSSRFDVHPYERYVGLDLIPEGFVNLGDSVAANVICVNPEGMPIAAENLTARLIRHVYNTVYERDASGYYRYKSEHTYSAVDSVALSVTDTGAAIVFNPPSHGRYAIEVSDGTTGHESSVDFYVSGWGYAPWSLEHPDRVTLEFDKQSYAVGDQAELQVQAPFPGKLLITIEKDKVLETIPLDLDSNTASIDLTVREDYFPNVYVTATVIRKADQIKEHLPARAFGIAPLSVSTSSRSIQVEIVVPETAQPRDSIDIVVQTDARPGSAVAIALVDAGILQLTDYKTPDPLSFFYGRKRPYLAPYDMYDFVYPEVGQAESHLSPAGGYPADLLADMTAASSGYISPVNAMRVKPVALWSGILKADDSGAVAARFALPQFNGELRVMVVVASENEFGSATASTKVRDQIVLLESFPRFIAPMDTVDALITVFNNTGHEATITLDVVLDGPAEVVGLTSKAVQIGTNKKTSIIFPVVASAAPGAIDCTIRGISGGDTAMVEFQLPNRPPQPLKTIHGSLTVSSDSAVIFSIPDDWYEGTGRYAVRTASLSTVTLARQIQHLLSYPYGCLEQTTSRVFPLLYFDDIARFAQPGIFGGHGHEYFIQEGIDRIQSMSASDGRFTYWPGHHDVHYWSSVYATHFLVEARKAGYDVNDQLYDMSLTMMTRIARGQQTDEGRDVAVRVYAALVLAKAGKMDNRTLNYLRTLHTDELAAFSTFQLAMVFALSGDTEYARTLVPVDIQPANFDPETGGNFSSGIRTNAILLDMLMETDPSSPTIPVLAKSLLEDARLGRWYTTQETAFALMALGKYLKGQQPPDFTGRIEIVGDTTYAIDTSAFMLERRDLGGKDVRVSITGFGPCYVYWQSTGVSPDLDIDEYDRGIKIRRTYFTADGREQLLDDVRPGDQVVCCITAESQSTTLANVVISDLLPGCFEIDNPRLAGSPSMRWIQHRNSRLDYMDVRDDRLLLFADIREDQQFNYYYSLRCIAAGNFIVPPVAAECMYNPTIAGAASSGHVRSASE